MWHERFCGFYIRHPQKKTKKCPRRKKIPQKFNMSLPGELSKVSPDYEIHCPTHNCHFWYPVWIFAIFWILPALWRFFANCAKFAISQICQFHQNRHSLRGLAIFRHFYEICHFRQNRHSPRSQFWHPIWIAITQAFFWPFFPIFSIAWNSGRNTNLAFNNRLICTPSTCVLQNMTHYLLVTPHTKLYARGSQNKLNLPRTVIKTSLVTEFPTPLSAVHR